MINTLQINESYVLQFKSHYNREIERIDKKTTELIETFENALSDKKGNQF